MPLTLMEQTALAVTPKVTAGLSVFFSSIIVYLVLSDPMKRKKVFHRLILGMSMTDVATSFWWVMSTWPIPRESGTLWAVGTTRTCTCQGFWLQVGIANPLYNLSLSVYYLMAVHWSWGEAKLKQIEIFFHLGPLGWGIGTAIAGIPLKIFNNANIWCWIADHPGRNEHTAPYRWGIFYAPLWLAAFLVSINLAKVVTYFQRVTNKYEKHVELNPSIYVSESEQIDHEYDVDEFGCKVESGESQEFASDSREFEVMKGKDDQPQLVQEQKPGQESEQEKQPELQQNAGQDPEEASEIGHQVEQMLDDEVEPSFHSSIADFSVCDGEKDDTENDDDMNFLDALVADFQSDFEDITSLFQQAMTTDAEDSSHEGAEGKHLQADQPNSDKNVTEETPDANDGDVLVDVADPVLRCMEAGSDSASADSQTGAKDGTQTEETEADVEPQPQSQLTKLQLEQQPFSCHPNAITSSKTDFDMGRAKEKVPEMLSNHYEFNDNNAANTRCTFDVPCGEAASMSMATLPLPARLFARFRSKSMGAGTVSSFDRGSGHTRFSRNSWNSRNNNSRFGHRRRRLAWQCLRYALVFYATWFPITLLRILQAAGKPIGFPILFLAALLTPLQGLPNFLVYLYPLFVEKFKTTNSPFRCVRAVWRKLYHGASSIAGNSSERNSSPPQSSQLSEHGAGRRIRPRSQQTGLGPGSLFTSEERLTPIVEEDRDDRGDGSEEDEASFQRVTFFRFDHPCTVSSLDASQTDLLETTDPQFRWDVYERKTNVGKEGKRDAIRKGSESFEGNSKSERNKRNINISSSESDRSKYNTDGPPALPARVTSTQHDDLDDLKDSENVSIDISGITEERTTPQNSDPTISCSAGKPSSTKTRREQEEPMLHDSGHDSRPSKPQRVESESESKFFVEYIDEEDDDCEDKVDHSSHYIRGRPVLDLSGETVPPRKPIRKESQNGRNSRYETLLSEITMEEDFTDRSGDSPV